MRRSALMTQHVRQGTGAQFRRSPRGGGKCRQPDPATHVVHIHAASVPATLDAAGRVSTRLARLDFE